MKKFKLIYYVIYGLFTGLIFYLAANLISVIDTLKDWGWYTYLSELPTIGSRFFYVTGFFLIIAVAIENYFTFAMRGERKKLEQEIVSLKAKLYDQSNSIEQSATPEINEAPEETSSEEVIPEADTNEEENPKEGE